MTAEPEQLRRHLQAMAAVNRQLQAQLAEVRPAGGPGAAGARVVVGGGLGPRGVSSARWAWRQVAPLLPPATAEEVRRRVKPRLVARPVPSAVRSGGAGPARTVAVGAGAVTRAAPSPRHAVATEWLRELADAGPPAQASLVRRSDGVVYLVEDQVARRVKSGVIAATLEKEFGRRRPITEEEAESFSDGAPVEVLVAASGVPFVISGGVRRPLRGLPVPYPVEDEEQLSEFAEGEALDVARANVSRYAERPPVPATRLPGPVAGLVQRAAKAARRLGIPL
jgi:hypothetical protein